VYDSVELGRAYTVGFQGRSYTLRIDTVVVDRTGTVRYDSPRIVRVRKGGERLLSRRHVTGRNVSGRLTPEQVRAYTDGNRTVLAFTDDGGTKYVERAGPVELYRNRLSNGVIDSEPIARRRRAR